jgi:uncharacterized RDD family membrane protein YckC
MLEHRVTTPEQVQLTYPLAGLCTRALAWSLDQCILLAATIALGLSAAGLGLGLAWTIVLLGKFLLDFGYWTWYELRRGQTPGKRVFGIRVVSASGGRLAARDVLLRSLLRVLDNPALIPFLGIVGGLCAWIDPRRRRLGDLAADTIVIRLTQGSLPAGLIAQQARGNTFAEDPALRSRVLTRVTRAERDLVLDLMLRRDELDLDTREQLFHEAAGYFRRRYGLPEDLEHLSDEQSVLNLAGVLHDTRFDT